MKLDVTEAWCIGAQLSDYIHHLAEQYARGPRERYALIAKAWEWLSVAQADKTDEWYRGRIYWLLYRESLMFHAGEKRA